MYTSIISKKSDLLGIMASGLCAVHCAVTPFFFAARPLLDNAICQLLDSRRLVTGRLEVRDDLELSVC